jgi:hypothetical protein
MLAVFGGEPVEVDPALGAGRARDNGQLSPAMHDPVRVGLRTR